VPLVLGIERNTERAPRRSSPSRRRSASSIRWPRGSRSAA